MMTPYPWRRSMNGLALTLALAVAVPGLAAAQETPVSDEPALVGSTVAASQQGTRVRIGRDILVKENEQAETIVAIGGSIAVDGVVTGDVVSVLGSVRLGPKAQVRGDVTAVGGTIDTAEGARVLGAVNEVSLPNVHVQGPSWPTIRVEPLFDGRMFAGLALTAMAARMITLSVIVLLIWAIGGAQVRRVGDAIAASPLTTVGVGLLATVLIIPVTLAVVVALVLSIVGIPLLALVPFALLLLALVWAGGFAAVAHRVGRTIGGDGVGGVAVGLTLLWVLTLVARVGAFAMPHGVAGWSVFGLIGFVGFAVEAVTWLAALGGVIMAYLQGTVERNERPTLIVPPTVPSAPAHL